MFSVYCINIGTWGRFCIGLKLNYLVKGVTLTLIITMQYLYANEAFLYQ